MFAGKESNSLTGTEDNDTMNSRKATTSTTHQLIDFQKAFDKLKEHSSDDVSGLPSGTERSYLCFNKVCFDVPALNASEKTVSITVKASKTKHKLSLQTNWCAPDILKYISYSVQIPLDKLKLICKGCLLTKENIVNFVKEKAVFQAIGEKAEDEVGLDNTDIDVLMRQLHVDRNDAIKALKEKGDVIDAMLYIGNK